MKQTKTATKQQLWNERAALVAKLTEARRNGRIDTRTAKKIHALNVKMAALSR